MSDHHTAAANQTIDHESSFARIRAELADLGAAIVELRTEADRLIASASSRFTVVPAVASHVSDAVVDGPSGPAFGPVEVLHQADEGSAAVEAAVARVEPVPVFGESRAAVHVDPGEAGRAPVDVAEAPVWRAVVVEPPVTQVEGPLADDETAEAGVPSPAPVEQIGPMFATTTTTSAAPAPGDATAGDAGAGAASPEEVVPSPATDVTSAPDPTIAVPPRTHAAPVTPVEQPTVAATEYAPVDWGQAVGEDDDAFERFFSEDVEPEPAQRWLLES